jgi:two-component system LytT family response regulator
MLKTIVIDDEKLSREVLCNYLHEYCPEVEVVATASSVMGAYKVIRKHLPDFVFLDVEITDGKGFDLLTLFDHIDFRIIFVTAYSEYAVKAFRVSAVDYLLKPVKIDELKDAIERVKALNSTAAGSDNLSALFDNLKTGPGTTPTLVIPHLKGFEVLKIPEIIMCHAEGYCTNFFMTGNRKVTSSKNLKHFEALLSDHNFIRVHNSYLVNIDHVSGYSKQGEVILSDGNRAGLGDSYKNSFVKRFLKK